MIKNKKIYATQFNYRFKNMMNYVSNKFKNNIDLVSKINLSLKYIKSPSNRFLIYLFHDSIIDINSISNQIIKEPNDDTIEFFEKTELKDIVSNTNDKMSLIFDQIKNIFKICDKSFKVRLLKELYYLKCITIAFEDSHE